MANITIDQLRALPDFADLSRWDITFVTLPAVGVLGFPLSEGLNVRCETVELPKGNNQKMEVQIRGHKVFQSGTLDYGNSITLTFNETVDNRIFLLVKAWRELCWESRQGRAFPKKDLEATILLTLSDSQGKVRSKYTIYGCFYESDDMGSLGNVSEVQKPSLTLSFDFFVDAPLAV